MENEIVEEMLELLKKNPRSFRFFDFIDGHESVLEHENGNHVLITDSYDHDYTEVKDGFEVTFYSQPDSDFSVHEEGDPHLELTTERLGKTIEFIAYTEDEPDYLK